MLKRTVLVGLASFLGLLLILGVRTFGARSRQVPPGNSQIDVATDTLAAYRLGAAVRFKTVTVSDESTSYAYGHEFQEFRSFLFATYPRVFTRLHYSLFSDVPMPSAPHALLIAWKGSNPDLEPVLLLAHQDVVPVEPETEGDWQEPPYSGRISEGYVWGRGSMDDKGSLIAILEAVESLLASNFQPERTLYVAFGHDEETGGKGAQAIARELAEEVDRSGYGRGGRSRRRVGASNQRLAFVLDEGLAVTQGYLPGFKNPVALIGIAEKGSALIELTARAKGGHASMPPRPSASGLIAEAVAALEAHPMPASLDGPTRRMLEFLAPEAPFPLRTVFANLWLFDPIVKANLARKSATDATTRTTMAVVRLESGVKENVVPSEARAVVSFRIRPGDTVADVLSYVRSRVDTTHMTVTLLPGSREPSPVSDTDSPGFRVVAGAIRQVFPDAVVAPALVLGGTDSRHFTEISDAVYRFMPLRFLPGDDARVHGTNERVSVENVTEMVRFYRALILAASRPF